MPYRFLKLLLAILVSLVGIAHSQMDGGAVVILESAKKVYRSGEPLMITVKLVNRGTVPLLILKQSWHRMPSPGIPIEVKVVKRFGASMDA